MAIFKPPRGSDETLKSFILEKGEIVYNTTDGKFYTGDDETLGGVLLNGGSSTPAPAPEQDGVTMDEVTNAILSAITEHAETANATYATKDELNAIEIPDVTGFATAQALNEVAASIPSIAGLASEEELAAVSAAIPDVAGFATTEALDAHAAEADAKYATTAALEEVSAAIPEVSGFVTKEELAAHAAEADAKYVANDVLSAYATKSALESVYATKLEVSEFYDLAATKEALAEHTAEADDKYATKAEVSTKIGDADLDPIRIELEKKLEAKDIESKLDSSTFDTWTENANALYASKYALSQASKEIEDLKGENVALKADHAADVASLKAEIKANKVAAKVEPFVPGTATTDADEVYMDSSVELTTNTILSAKNLVIDNANISAESGSVFEATVKDTFDVADATFTSNTNKNANVTKVKDAETVIIKDTTFTGNSYNTLMTGQNCAEGKYIKNMVIENCKFDDICAHIYIWFAAFLDGATLTIKNCTFKECEQMLCISDFQGSFDNKLTVVIKDCTIERYDNYKPGNNGWYGLILCDSRKAPAGQFEALNPFGDGKVTIYIDNVVAGGTKLTQENFKMGVDGTDQMLYIYKANERANVSMSEETKHLFPTVIVK